MQEVKKWEKWQGPLKKGEKNVKVELMGEIWSSTEKLGEPQGGKASQTFHQTEGVGHHRKIRGRKLVCMSWGNRRKFKPQTTRNSNTGLRKNANGMTKEDQKEKF